jgi:hypothetical protein
MVSGRDMTRWAVDYAMLVVIAMKWFREGKGWHHGSYQQRTRQSDYLFHVFLKEGWEGEAVELVMIVIVPFVVVPTTTMVVASAGEKASAETTG